MISPRPLRVAFIASSLKVGGAEKQAYYMARALYQAGVDVRFFYLGRNGHYETLLRQSGVPFRQIHTSKRTWVMFASLMATLWQLKPQIVIAGQFGDLRYAIPAGRFCNAMILGGVRSDGFFEFNTYGRKSRWMARSAHGLIANSCRATQNLVFKGVNPLQIEVLPNVIDLRDFDDRAKQPSGLALPQGRAIATAVGSLQPCKCFDRFLEALALARRSEPSLAGVIAGGDRGMKAELQRKAYALGLTPHLGAHHVAFVGEVDRVPALLAESSFLVLTSDFEGFPNVILEAMAARLPVISTPAGDSRLIVQHGKTGYMVEPDDIRGMARQMVQLAQTPALRKSLGETARRCVEQEYSYPLLAERLLTIFHSFALRHEKIFLCELLEQGAPLPKKRPEPVSGSLMLEPPAA